MIVDRFGFKIAAESFLDGLSASREVNIADLRQLLSRAYFNGCEDGREELSAALRGKREPTRRFMSAR